MSSKFDELVSDELAPLLKAHKFRKKGLNFGRRNADGWSVIQIQKFEHSTRTMKRFAINVSAFSDRLDREMPRIGARITRRDTIPPELACHLRKRLGELVPDKRAPDSYGVDDNTDIAELGATLRMLVANHALPFLDSVASDRGMYEYWSMHTPEGRDGLQYALLVRLFDTPDALVRVAAHLRATTSPDAKAFHDALDQIAAPPIARVQPDPVTRQMMKTMREAIAVESDPSAYDRAMERCLALDDGEASDARGEPSLPPFRLRPYLNFGMSLAKRGALGRAVAILEPLLPRWPDDFHLHLTLASFFERTGTWNRAEAALRRAHEIEPKAFVCVMVAKMVDHQGQRVDEAIAWLHRALELDPHYEEAHFNLGCLDERNGDIDAAIARFRRAIELDPDYQAAHARLGALLNHRRR